MGIVFLPFRSSGMTVTIAPSTDPSCCVGGYEVFCYSGKASYYCPGSYSPGTWSNCGTNNLVISGADSEGPDFCWTHYLYAIIVIETDWNPDGPDGYTYDLPFTQTIIIGQAQSGTTLTFGTFDCTNGFSSSPPPGDPEDGGGGPPPSCGADGGGSGPSGGGGPPGGGGAPGMDGAGGGGPASPTNGPGPVGMPVWQVSEPYISLWLHDEPLGYQPAIGPRISFKLAYKQREATAGLNPNLFSVGKKWNLSWFSYVTQTLSLNSQLQTSTNYTIHLGNGMEVTFSGTNGAVASSGTNDYLTNTRLSGDITNGFTLLYPDGSQDVYDFLVPFDGGGFCAAFLSRSLNAQSQATVFNYSYYYSVKLY